MQREEQREIHYQFNKKLFGQGVVLALLGVAGPFLIMERRLGIYHSLTRAMLQDDCGQLILAALKLVCMNVIRMVPHYLGAFLLNESLHIYRNGKKYFLFNICFTVFLIGLIYEVIYRMSGIRYDLGIPALLTIGFVLILSYMDLFSVGMLNKILLVGSLLMSIQWLDVIPYLTEYGFGRGEISVDVKKASEFMGEEMLLAVFAGCMCAAFFFAAMIQVQLLYKEHKLKISNEKTRKMEKELYNTQIEALKLRHSSEVQSLVHDLKSPLTTIEGLLSLAEMMEENSLIKEYFGKIQSALGNLSTMISEILYESARGFMTTAELMRMILAQVSITIPDKMLRCENLCPDSVIRGNQIRLSRAVINILTNAYQAVDKETGQLQVSVERQDGWIRIAVLDNGTGIAPEEMNCVWEPGYSGRQSTGLGLAFARQVIENHGGTIQIESEKGKYTNVVILLKEEEGDGNGKDHSGDR